MRTGIGVKQVGAIEEHLDSSDVRTPWTELAAYLEVHHVESIQRDFLAHILSEVLLLVVVGAGYASPPVCLLPDNVRTIAVGWHAGEILSVVVRAQ
ncbi:hypothetical protein D3C86_1816770 [compost metagenome]